MFCLVKSSGLSFAAAALHPVYLVLVAARQAGLLRLFSPCVGVFWRMMKLSLLGGGPSPSASV
jgi:hypothetical protein